MSTELGWAANSASRCLTASSLCPSEWLPLMPWLSLALALLLTQEGGSIPVSATLGGPRTAHPPHCLVLS